MTIFVLVAVAAMTEVKVPEDFALASSSVAMAGRGYLLESDCEKAKAKFYDEIKKMKLPSGGVACAKVGPILYERDK